MPLAYGATAWGLGALTSSWGYPSYSYANPYYAETSATPYYDYAQPITVTNYATAAPADDATSPAPAQPAEDTKTTQAYATFEQARNEFRSGNYRAALDSAKRAIEAVPNDPILHEFAALCMFAQKEYSPAAAVLNNVLAVAPGMDWTSMSDLYPSVSVYEGQLQALKQYCDAHPTDAPSHFVLAYHALVCGDPQAAKDALQVVVQAQPKDQVARTMLASLAEGDEGQSQPMPDAAPTPAPTPASPPAANQPTTDLVGTWSAKQDKLQFDLSLSDDGKFQWKSVAQGQKPVELSGDYSLNNEVLLLESGNQGTMVAKLTPKDADHFQFQPADSPPGDQGLNFARAK